MNMREINDDLLKDWLEFREETVCSITSIEDKRHFIKFEEICENILNNVSGNNYEYIKNQLNVLDNNFMDYIDYWNEKYYRNGFCDAVELISGCFNK